MVEQSTWPGAHLWHSTSGAAVTEGRCPTAPQDEWARTRGDPRTQTFDAVSWFVSLPRLKPEFLESNLGTHQERGVISLLTKTSVSVSLCLYLWVRVLSIAGSGYIIVRVKGPCLVKSIFMVRILNVSHDYTWLVLNRVCCVEYSLTSTLSL